MATLVVDFAALDRLRTAITTSIDDASQHLQTLTDQVKWLVPGMYSAHDGKRQRERSDD